MHTMTIVHPFSANVMVEMAREAGRADEVKFATMGTVQKFRKPPKNREKFRGARPNPIAMPRMLITLSQNNVDHL